MTAPAMKPSNTPPASGCGDAAMPGSPRIARVTPTSQSPVFGVSASVKAVHRTALPARRCSQLVHNVLRMPYARRCGAFAMLGLDAQYSVLDARRIGARRPVLTFHDEVRALRG
jgi:hypothetical protein